MREQDQASALGGVLGGVLLRGWMQQRYLKLLFPADVPNTGIATTWAGVESPEPHVKKHWNTSLP
jgi:hypothetical protein